MSAAALEIEGVTYRYDVLEALRGASAAAGPPGRPTTAIPEAGASLMDSLMRPPR